MKTLFINLILLGSLSTYAYDEIIGESYGYEVTCGGGGGPGSGSNSMCNGNSSNSSNYGSYYARQVLRKIKEKDKNQEEQSRREFEKYKKAEMAKKHGTFRDFSYVGDDSDQFLSYDLFTLVDTGLRFSEDGQLHKTDNDYIFHIKKGIDGKVFVIKLNDDYSLFNGGQYALARLRQDLSDFGKIYDIFLPNGEHTGSLESLEGFNIKNFRIIRELKDLELIYNPIFTE